MSLVAYAASSEEESDNELEINTASFVQNGLNGQISDDEDEYGDPIVVMEKTHPPDTTRKLLNLPAPSISQEELAEIDDERIIPSFEKLPKPKTFDLADNEVIIEEDDEFLRKKESLPFIEKPPTIIIKGPVRITIPSLSEFKDLEVSKKPTVNPGPSAASKPTGLIGLLPKPKHGAIFAKSNTKDTPSQGITSATSLIPDSVKNRTSKKSKSTLKNPLKPQPKKSLVAHISDSDGSDDDGDFFSLNTEEQLPEVCVNEINAMVAKKAAQMAEATSRIDELIKNKSHDINTKETEDETSETQPSTSQEVRFDDRAMHALVGSRAKRRKIDEVNIVELSTNQVLPDKDEWLRSALASATSYQAKGVLTDEEPAPGTRKKHQITYLAHQAKANEQELQAMWSANRHTRRQTQGKYGF